MKKMYLFTIPYEAKKHNIDYSGFDDIPEDIFSSISENFKKLNSAEPLVSINIIAWNEEKNILRTLSSLSEIKSKYPVEVIVVDNNSVDRTSEIIRRCGLTPVHEKKQGYGFARQAALQASKGKIILTGDSDTIYLPGWVDAMVKNMVEQKAIATFGSYAFIPPADTSRFSLAVYEQLRNFNHFFKRISRPHLSVVGMNFGFLRKDALEIGFVKENIRGEDGRMAFELAKRGKVIYISCNNSVVWTHYRSLRSTGVWDAFKSHAKRELKRLNIYFSKYKE